MSDEIPDGYIDIAEKMDHTLTRMDTEGWSKEKVNDFEMSNQISDMWKNQKRLIHKQEEDDKLRPTVIRVSKYFSNAGIGIGIVIAGLLTTLGGWIFVQVVQPDTARHDAEMELLREVLKKELGIDVKGPEQKK